MSELPDLTPEQRQSVARFLEHAEIMHGVPEPAELERMVFELERLGLRDESEYRGISGSVRQYAINVLMIAMQRWNQAQQQPRYFVTLHHGLLGLADQRYGLRPITPGRLQKLASR